MEFDNSFEVPLPPDQAWAVLMDIQRHRALHAGRGTDRGGRRQDLQGQDRGAARPGRADLRRPGEVRGDRQHQPHRAREGAGQRRQGPRLGASRRDLPAGAVGHRLQGAGAHRPDAVGRGRAIRPRRRHDPGDGVGADEPVRQQPEGASGAERDGAARCAGGRARFRGVAGPQACRWPMHRRSRPRRPRPPGADAGGGQADLRLPRWCGQVRVEFHPGQVRAESPTDDHPTTIRSILVDDDDVAVGTAGKLDAHRRGLKHRAISVLVRNAKGEFLLQRRAARRSTIPAGCGPTPAAAIRCRTKARRTPRIGGSSRRWASTARSSRCSCIHYAPMSRAG